MAEKTRTYRRLPGASRLPWTSPTQTHLGDDHILVQNRSLFVERYRRFYLRDIQAVIVQRTSAGTGLSVVLGTAVGLLLVIALATMSSHPALWVSVAALVGALILNVGLGPTCRCYLRTAVNVQRLPTILRLRSAERFLAGVGPLIEASQADLAPDAGRAGAPESPHGAPASGGPGAAGARGFALTAMLPAMAAAGCLLAGGAAAAVAVAAAGAAAASLPRLLQSAAFRRKIRVAGGGEGLPRREAG